MQKAESPARVPIDAQCPDFVCRLCRTKTGWPHQRGCTETANVRPTCADCRYWREKDRRCHHPARRKEAPRETDPHTL